MLIYAPPAVLTLHLKRFEQVGSGLRKLTRHVEFSELLDLAPYCSRLAKVMFNSRCLVLTAPREYDMYRVAQGKLHISICLTLN